MKRLPLALVLVLLLAACLPVTEADTAAGPAIEEVKDAIAFVNVSVLPMDSERVLEGQTVIVGGDRILAMGPADEVEVPPDATVIDGAGRFLLPGLAEMHGHIPPPSAPQAFIDNVLFLYVASGITTVRGMLGWPGQLALRERANAGEVVAPTLYLAGPSFNGNSVSSPEQARQMVRDQVAEGWDLLKVHPGLSRAEYDAMAETANELGIRFGGHVPADVGLTHAIAMNQETFDHVDGYVEHLAQFGEEAVDEAALAEIVETSREAGVWIVPTMALWEVLYGTRSLEELTAYDELKYFPPDQVAAWTRTHRQRLSSPQRDEAAARRVIAARMRVLDALNEGGVRILMGTDAPQQFSVPGFSLHRELEVMEQAGMSRYDILRSGTKNVGEYFSHKDEFGTVAVGQRADLLLAGGNPLDDLAHLQDLAGVMVRGQWISEADLQQRLAAIAADYADDGS